MELGLNSFNNEALLCEMAGLKRRAGRVNFHWFYIGMKENSSLHLQHIYYVVKHY
jgi:hypothetical protein